MLADTMQRMADDGVQRAIAFVTSAFSCYSGCRQYREDIQRAREMVGAGAPEIEKLRVFYNHPGFIEPMIDNVRAALAKLDTARRDQAHVVFTAHSIPLSMAEGCEYQWQLEEACRLVAAGVGGNPWQLVFQSRSGAPHHPWLEPDVCDYIRECHSLGSITDVIIAPIGFISDHMEVLFDLDTEAKDLSDKLGMTMQRAATVGCDPRFVSLVRELVMERMSPAPVRRCLGAHGPSHDVCPEDCCLPGQPPGRPSLVAGAS
jgi:ferrochelatase